MRSILYPELLLANLSGIPYYAPMNKRELIMQARAERGMSVDELSKLSSVPRTTLYGYFNGADMRGSAVEAVERALGMSAIPPHQTRLRPADSQQEPQHGC